jgi:dTDP-4-dehydrorhamnose 3,5-epimerase
VLFTASHVRGVFLIEPERRIDERGFFARTWCQQEFSARGLNPCVAQCNTSLSHKQGTLRGLHYQVAPHAEAKLVRCVRGAVFDVAVDLRTDSPTLHQWFGAELTADNRQMLYVPQGCAHGYLTLCDDTEVLYQVSDFYCPQAERGVRWNDPKFGISWPQPLRVISPKDGSYRLLEDQRAA